ncbi:MAG: HAD family hydrolase [Bacteroidota bacterium]
MEYKAAILDLDGVITQTAEIHARAWKKLFDHYNEERNNRSDSTYDDFSIRNDYPKYLDGIPRYDGVRKFLEAKGIKLPYGNPEDEPTSETICGLGNRKNGYFQQALQEKGVTVFEDAVKKIHDWKAQGMKLAVISSSKNCKPILEEAGLIELFDAIVDGLESEKRNLKGKPAPDIFLEAAKDLNVSSRDAFIVEDALSGVEAGKKGDFGLVVGIARKDDTEALKEHGADKVVTSLTDLKF